MCHKRTMNFDEIRASMGSKKGRWGELHTQAHPDLGRRYTNDSHECFHEVTLPETQYADFVIPEIRLSLPDGSERVLYPSAYMPRSRVDSDTPSECSYPRALPTTLSLPHQGPSPSFPRTSETHLAQASCIRSSYVELSNSRGSPALQASPAMSRPQIPRLDVTSWVHDDMNAAPMSKSRHRCTRRPECRCTWCCAANPPAAPHSAGCLESLSLISLMNGISRLAVSATLRMEHVVGRTWP